MRKNLTARMYASLPAAKLRWFGLLALLIIGTAWLGTRAGNAFVPNRIADDTAVAGVVSGTVFQDYNANGRRDTAATITNSDGSSLAVAFDRGVAGVTVTAYAANGSEAGSATTGDDGSYSINAAGSGPYRVEFTNLPAGYFPGTVGDNSRGNVRFIDGGSASNIDYGIVLPMAYCQDNPTLITACYVGGDQLAGSNPVIVSFPYSAGSARMDGGLPVDDFDQPVHGNLVNSDKVGTVWGLAYARGSRTLYASSFMKKHAGFGPGGTGAIYQINPSNGATSEFVNAGALTGANPHDNSNFDTDNGNASWDAVGKRSFGGIALNGAETRLFAMNLNDRKLYEFATDGSGTRASAAITNAPGCASGDVRPFAVNWSNGQLYVGVTCTAESTQAAADMQGYVYRVDPATLALDAAPLFQFSLNYPRRCADSAQNGPGSCFSAAWRPWTAAFATIGTEERGIYPQPWLTDIAFDRGNLVIGLRDRSGDQFGTDTLDNPSDGIRYYGVSAGDTLRAVSNGSGGFVLESNGRAGGQGTGPQNTNEGPGGGEYYFTDFAPPFNDESTIGALAQIPGHPNVLVNMVDPIPLLGLSLVFDGGTAWFNNNTGGRTKSYRIYDGSRRNNVGALDFGKANGLGDIVVVCDPAPIELGNRIWNDLDCDGIQDAGEPGLGGIGLQLIKNGVVVATTTSMPTGGYYFDPLNVPGGILPNMDYLVCLTSLPAGFVLAPKDADGSANGDIRDSDAMLVDGKACIPVTTGGPGQTNPNLDFGLKLAPPTITCPAPVSVCAVAGATTATVTYAAPTTTGDSVTVVCSPASGSSFALGTTTVNCTATNAGGSASCSFVVTVRDAPTISCPANITTTATSTSGAVVTYTTPTGGGTGTTVSCDLASGSTFPIGTTTVTCTATNSCGTVTCSFTVTVNVPPPTITCPAPINICLPAGVTNANVSYVATTTGIGVTLVCTPPSGSNFALGTSTVNCRATNAGGEATCSFSVRVGDAPTIACPTNIKALSTGSGAVVNYPVPVGGGLGTTVSCDRASGSTFPIGTTTVKCTATNACGTAMCSFTVTVDPVKCDTLCYRSAAYWLLNPYEIPNGTVVIYGVNNNAPVSTSRWSSIVQALQGNPMGANLTPREVFNREYVAAQLNILNQGGPGSPVWVNTMWANLSCYGITFNPITVGSGAVLTRDSMVKELYMHITAAVQSRNDADLAKLTVVLQLLNGNNPLNVCN